jgi:hypothetical protein
LILTTFVFKKKHQWKVDCIPAEAQALIINGDPGYVEKNRMLEDERLLVAFLRNWRKLG